MHPLIELWLRNAMQQNYLFLRAELGAKTIFAVVSCDSCLTTSTMDGSAFYGHGWLENSAECPISNYSPWNASYLPSFSATSVTQEQQLQYQEPSRGTINSLFHTHTRTLAHKYFNDDVYLLFW